MEKRSQHCPVCGNQYGRVELHGGSELQTRYVHTDLVDVKEVCRVFADGRTERVEAYEPVTP